MLERLDKARVFVSPIVESTGVNAMNILALTRGVPLVTTPTGSSGRSPPRVMRQGWSFVSFAFIRLSSQNELGCYGTVDAHKCCA